MKKSEFRAARRSWWGLRGASASLDELVDRDVRAAEAAGKVWDPEEPELPAQISVIHAEDCGDRYRCHLVPKPLEQFVDQKHQARTYTEAMRRHNLFPEVRRWAEEHLRADLLAVLDRKS